MAQVSIRSSRMKIARPSNAAKSDPASLELGLVEVREPNPPSVVKPLVWRLATTLPVDSPEEGAHSANAEWEGEGFRPIRPTPSSPRARGVGPFFSPQEDEKPPHSGFSPPPSPLCWPRAAHEQDRDRMSADLSILFTPFNLSGLELKNRFVMSPMTRSRAPADGVPDELTATYYSQRASAGLVDRRGHDAHGRRGELPGRAGPL